MVVALIGVDGAPAGWISAWAPMRPQRTPEMRLYPDFAALVADAPEGAIIAVDMPMGLPARTPAGGRACERAARAYLGPGRGSSVFSTSSRRAIFASDYAAACAVIREDLPDRRGLSKQAWGIAPKMREVDAVVRRRPSASIRESHPEVIFAHLNGGAALAAGKKTPEGRAQRLALLEAAGIPASACLTQRPSGVGRDDLVDALACLRTARRIAAGKAKVFGEAEPFAGQRTGIWV